MGNTLNEKYGLKHVINASGRMSILGVSTLTDTVVDAMRAGGQNYVEIADLVNKAGMHIADVVDSEDAVVVNSASSGIVLSIAAMVTRGDHLKSEKLHQKALMNNEIIMLKGHNVQYGAPIETMVALGGGDLVEVGYANEGKAEHISNAINDKTAAILYVKSHHAVQKNMIAIEDVWDVAQANNIPLIIDAAAEADLKHYIQISDLVMYSGSKAIEGPTSGIVAGKKIYVDWVKTQLHYIGRSMKVGKEAIFGLLQALDEYMSKAKDNSFKDEEKLKVLTSLSYIEGVEVKIVQDEAGRAIFRARIQIDPTIARETAQEVNNQLKNGNVAIYTRDYSVQQGFFDIDPRPLKENDIHIIKNRLETILGGRLK